MISISDLTEILNILLFTCIVTFLISIPTIDILFKFGITRKVDVAAETIKGRTSKAGTPIMGGIVIILGVLLVNVVYNRTEATNLILLLFFAVALLGGIDDVLNIYGKERGIDNFKKGISVKGKNIMIYPWLSFKKFFYQLGSLPGKGLYSHERIIIEFLIASAFSYYAYLNIPDFQNIIFPIFDFNLGVLIIPLSILLILIFINGVNISDGMDALSSGMMFPSFMAIGLIALCENEFNISLLSFSIAGSLLAYLYFNVPPARFQMGDAGALALGAIMSGIMIVLKQEILLLIIGLPYIIEFGSSYLQIFWVKKFGHRLFKIAPIHYHFQKTREWSEEKIVMRFVLFSSLVSMVGVMIYLI